MTAEIGASRQEIKNGNSSGSVAALLHEAEKAVNHYADESWQRLRASQSNSEQIEPPPPS